MREMSAGDAARSLSELIEYTRDSGEPIRIYKTGGSGAVMLSAFRYEMLLTQIKRQTAELDALKAEFAKMNNHGLRVKI